MILQKSFFTDLLLKKHIIIIISCAVVQFKAYLLNKSIQLIQKYKPQ